VFYFDKLLWQNIEMKKSYHLIVLITIFLMLGCSSDKNHQLILSCETQITQDKINDFSYAIEDNIETPKINFDTNAIAKNSVLNTFVKNLEYCIEYNYPFEKHTYIFNKNDLNNIGKYDISKSSSYCWTTRTKMLETLSVMKVTNNYLDFGESHSMRINKNNMSKGTKMSYISRELGPYEYECSLSKYE